jgi:DNA polymerase-3 subunit gamma/tau
MKTVSKLNLTRKWRSQTFDAIVGQEVSVRILKNSLFLDQIFPVYLFSGQRGCGKTTTARVFTAAVNCEKLIDFRKDPKANAVPCLTCASCLAIEQGKHPDFTEIDAASHTGVDNIRQLIETTAFLPIMGRKKVYLIDEVHMLSKAAFNALLKILEEPPACVIFILATTDPHKVIDTVKSRCFQLFFGPPETDLLLAHLQHVCKIEKINAEPQALAILIRESEGSVRDAMNLLEQVRFIESHISVKTVEQALGYVSDNSLLRLLELALSKDVGLVPYLNELDFNSKNVDFIWRRLCELLKMVLYAKQGVLLNADQVLESAINKIAGKFDLETILNFLGVVIGQEQLLLKTAHKSLILELFFLWSVSDIKKNLKTDQDHLAPELVVSQVLTPVMPKINQEIAQVLQVPVQDAWQQMLGLISSCGDPMIDSIFKQAQFERIDLDKKVQISFSDQGLFFKDLIFEKKAVWGRYLTQVFGEEAVLEISFVAREINPAEQVKTPFSNSNKKNEIIINKHLDSSDAAGRRMSGRQIDVADKEKWPLANQILEHFPGQVYEV